jgi:hypothetical protein
MTKFKTLASTKTINSANFKAVTRGYKMSMHSSSKCTVDIILRGKVAGQLTANMSNGAVSISEKKVIMNGVTPLDFQEAAQVANRYFTLIANK